MLELVHSVVRKLGAASIIQPQCMQASQSKAFLEQLQCLINRSSDADFNTIHRHIVELLDKHGHPVRNGSILCKNVPDDQIDLLKVHSVETWLQSLSQDHHTLKSSIAVLYQRSDFLTEQQILTMVHRLLTRKLSTKPFAL